MQQLREDQLRAKEEENAEWWTRVATILGRISIAWTIGVLVAGGLADYYAVTHPISAGVDLLGREIRLKYKWEVLTENTGIIACGGGISIFWLAEQFRKHAISVRQRYQKRWSEYYRRQDN